MNAPWRVAEARGTNDESCFHEIIDANHKTIASTWAGPNEANARLIAAAPELYEIVRKLSALRNGLAHSSSCAEYAATELAERAEKLVSHLTAVSA